MDQAAGLCASEVPVEVTRAVIAHQVELWRNTWENARVQVVVAAAIGDEGLREKSKAEMAKALKALARLQALERELPAAKSVAAKV